VPPGAPGIVALQLAFTPARFQAVLDAWGPAIVQQFVDDMPWDYLYAALYALALASWVAWLSRREGAVPSRGDLGLFMLPLIAGLCDWIENTLHLLLVTSAGPPAAWAVFLASVAASVKWGALVITLGGLLFLAGRRLMHAFKGRPTA
jgi:hypothetical protein